jgi:hypothetical protein
MADELTLPALIFPPLTPQLRTSNGRVEIRDAVRRAFVALTPEEWVRQHCVHWLVTHKHYPIGRCSVERMITGTGMRYDVLVVDALLKPFLLVECKSYDQPINADALRQSAWYNLTLKAPYILLTNGRLAYCAAVTSDGVTTSLDDVPVYPVAP